MSDISITQGNSISPSDRCQDVFVSHAKFGRWSVNFGARLARVRERQGFTQSSLARAVGLSQSAVSQIEAGSRNPSYTTIRELAEAMGVSPAELVEGEIAPDSAEQAFFRDYRGLAEPQKREVATFAAYLRAKAADKAAKRREKE